MDHDDYDEITRCVTCDGTGGVCIAYDPATGQSDWEDCPTCGGVGSVPIVPEGEDD